MMHDNFYILWDFYCRQHIKIEETVLQQDLLDS